MRLIDANHLKSMLQKYIKREQAYIDTGNIETLAIGHSNGLWEAIAQIDEEPTIEPHEWIPVTERLPEDGEYMFSWITSDFPNKRFIGIAAYEDGEWLFDDYMNAYIDVTVTAWMPLPEPYKVGQDD